MQFETDFNDAFTYNKETKCIAVEASTIQINHAPTQITLKNKVTGNSVMFEYFKRDQNSEGEIYGWHYRSTSKLFNGTLLLIND